MKKFAYYSLGAFLAVVPFTLIMLGLITLSYTSIDNYTLASIGVVLFGLYFIYLLWMFED